MSFFVEPEQDPTCIDEVREIFKGRNGHTMRRYPWKCQSVTTISRMNKRKGPSIHSDNNNNDKSEFPVTEIDDYFEPTFVLKQSYSRYYSENERPLNTKDRWECVMKKLEALAVKKTTSFERYHNTVATHYDVPIHGHLILTKDRNASEMMKEDEINEYHSMSKSKSNTSSSSGSNSRNRRWLYWNGKFHDPSYIYEYIPGQNLSSAGTLKQICPLTTGRRGSQLSNYEYQMSDNSNNLHDADRLKRYGQEIGSGCLIDPENTQGHYHRAIASDTSSSRRSKSANFLEIDLKQVCDIRAIITKGGYPRQLETFPTCSRNSTNRCSSRIAYVNTRRGRYGTVRRRRRRQPFVYVVKDRQSLSWVESFTLHYRDMNSGKWHPYGEPAFSGNEDVDTEKLTEVSIRSRYLRVTPIHYHRFREMRVTVLGQTVSNIGDAGKDSSCATNRDIAEMVETIRYTVHPVQSTLRYDGYTRGGKDYYGMESKHKKKNRFKSEVLDQLRSL